VSTSAEIVAWACFVLGIVILLAGVGIGILLSVGKTSKGVSAADAGAKVKAAAAQVDALKSTAVAGANNPSTDPEAAAAVSKQAAATQSVLEQIGGIVGSLPENLRFAGLLVLVGAALMSVATVQFGGHVLF
jgi:hypothetical protein